MSECGELSDASRRNEIARIVELLGVDRRIIRRMIANATADDFIVLDALVARVKQSARDRTEDLWGLTTTRIFSRALKANTLEHLRGPHYQRWRTCNLKHSEMTLGRWPNWQV
jgi:hypothetical protein